MEHMEKLKAYAEKYGVKEVKTAYGTRVTRQGSIVFPNGWVASIVENSKNEGRYSVAMCNYDGYFNWDILNQYGAENGSIECITEEEIIDACEIIRNLCL